MKKILSLLACPNCQTPLKKRDNQLICQNCQRIFLIKKKIFFLLGEDKISQRKKDEIRVFQDLSSYQELMSRPYFRELKEKITNSFKRYRFKGKTILEIGAGTSKFLPLFEKENELTALDISAVLLAQNKARANLIVGDAENLPFLDESFDLIYLVGVLHHLENQKKALREIKRALKVKGKVFISEPTKWSLNLPYYLIRKLAIKILGVDRFKNLSGCGSPEESFISLKAVKEVFGSDFQFKLHKILPLRMPPVKFLEQFFPAKLNDLFEKTPLIKNLGTIVFVEGEKQRRGE